MERGVKRIYLDTNILAYVANKKALNTEQRQRYLNQASESNFVCLLR
jgi:hypothetical protein